MASNAIQKHKAEAKRTKKENAADGVTRKLASFAADIQFATLPAAVVSKCKLLILDCLGNQIGAYGKTAPKIVYESAASLSESGSSTIVGWGTRAAPATAGLVNGTMAHTLDMDDAHRDSLTKTGSAITPAALAVAEAMGASGAEVIAAVVTGYELMIRLGLAVNPAHRQRGFHSTATLGTFGAAVTAGRLMRLDSDQITSALGIAGTQSAGLTAFINNPSMIKPFNVGRAVQSGIFAATLAARGFVGPTDILEGSEGFLQAYTASYKIQPLLEALGKHFHILECGFKPHAACRYAHGPIDAAVNLMVHNDFSPKGISRIDVHVSELAYRQSHFYEPVTISSAQGSTPFSIASGITQRTTSLTFPDISAAFENPETWDLHRRVFMHIDKEMDYMGRGCRLSVKLKNGQYHEAAITLPRGEPENPMTADEVHAKFSSQAVPVVGEQQSQALTALVAHLERETSVASLMSSTKALV